MRLFVLSLLVLSWIKPQCLTARTISLADPRPDIVRISADVELDISIQGEIVKRHPVLLPVVGRNGIISADRGAVMLNGWEFQLGSASSDAAIVVDNLPLTIKLSVNAWSGRLREPFASPLTPSQGGDPFLFRLTSAPTIDDFVFDSITGAWEIAGPIESISQPFEILPSDGSVLGGRFIDFGNSSFFDIGFNNSTRSTLLFDGIIDGVPVGISGRFQVAIRIAPEPMSSMGTVLGFLWLTYLLRIMVRSYERTCDLVGRND
jgi:hypothetical protein